MSKANKTTTLKRRRSYFRTPWFAYFYGILLVGYLYIGTNQELVSFYSIPAEYLDIKYQLGAMALFALIVLFEMARFRKNKQRYDRRMKNYEEKLDELLKSKSKLQHKVHQYSDHADKLKLFISDRLLEHIEYDEKFLHFKNIASEVRHNGVISYDKVTTSLKAALKKEVGKENSDEARYQDALESMAYLWDLLDLSTTDNIAMYVANKLYESEEHYYQQMLQEDEADFPYSPTFSMRNAVLKTLRPLVDESEGGLPPVEKSEEAYHYADSRFWLDLEDAGQLLGKENHIVLLVENLINNALFYANNKKYSGTFSRIALRLVRDGDQAKLMVYNRGPHISDEVKGQIFQLGFSTKRIRENNGKGLGLYFVHEIVKGYEGEISFENIINKEDAYLIRVQLGSGDEITSTINVVLGKNNRPMCSDPHTGDQSAKARYSFKEKIKSIEIVRQSTQASYIFKEFAKDEATTLVDPAHPEHPAWYLTLTPGKATSRLDFKPLDIEGVQFSVSLPTAESRLDASYHDMGEDELDNLEDLDKDFEEISDYVR